MLMDFSDFLPHLIELAVPFVSGTLIYFLTKLTTFFNSRTETNIAWDFASRFSYLVEDYIEDAATMTSGDLAHFRRPGSDGGERITDAELDLFARSIARRLLVEGAGVPWMERGFKLLGAKGAQPDDVVAAQHTVRKVKTAIRRREDEAEARGLKLRPLAPSPYPVVSSF